ncbi:metallophosphoesterase family protein [Candidatus Fermentibacteria bacterium]|nr:metallophosphoesterase family protein [Candidatus Fermentibacteria bacterium]
MTTAVLSDVHGNLEALDAVLAEIASLDIERLLVCGDVVGYGANPTECLDRLLDRHPVMVAGNHDWAAVGKLPTESFSDDAAAAVLWTSSRLDEPHRQALRTLPLEYRDEILLAVHSSPCAPSEWSYLVEIDDVRRAIETSDRPLCFVGHSHVPFVYGRGEGQEVFDRRPGRYPLRPGWRYLVNVGSVGQPRDGDPRASFALLHGESKTVELVRTPYDIRAAQEKIHAAALPEFLAWRLRWGF